MPVTKDVKLSVSADGASETAAEMRAFQESIKGNTAALDKLSTAIEQTSKRGERVKKVTEESTVAKKKNREQIEKNISAYEKFGKIKEKVSQGIERFNFVTLGLAGVLGGAFGGAIGGAVSAIQTLYAALTDEAAALEKAEKRHEKLTQAIKDQAEARKALRDAEGKAITDARGTIAGAIGVDTSLLAPSELNYAFEIGRKQLKITQERTKAEGLYFDTLARIEKLQKDGTGSRGDTVAMNRLLAQRANLATRLEGLRTQQISVRDDLGSFAPVGPTKRATSKTPGEIDKAVDELAKKRRERDIANADRARKDEADALQERIAQNERFRQYTAKRDADETSKRQQEINDRLAVVRRFDEEIKKQERARFDEGRSAGEAGGAFALIGETDVDRIRGIREAMHEGIIGPAQIARDSLDQLGQGFANAGAAAILEGKSFRKSSQEIFKAIAQQALAKALFEGAAALASLAILDFRGAALHGKAAAAFGLVAGATYAGARVTGAGSSWGTGGQPREDATTGGGRSTPGARVANTNSVGNGGGAVVYNFNVNYNGLRTDYTDHERLAQIINSNVGRTGATRIDYRMVG